MTRLLALTFITTLALGCKNEPSKLDAIMAAPVPNVGQQAGGKTPDKQTPAAPAKDIDSKAILARGEEAPEVQVKHVLISWKELEPAFRGGMDERAKKRTNEEAAKLAEEILGKLKANPDAITALMKEHSEDPGSAQTGEVYEVTPTTQFVPEFKKLALRLMLNEAGIVKTNYGYHVIIRIPPPPPDPVESADILARPNPETGEIEVQHVLIGWKGAPGAESATRTKEEADKLAREVLDKVRAGGDMAALMKQYSDDPGSKDSGQPYSVSPDAALVEPFKKLSLRLQSGEAGIVKSQFGFHVIKRLPPDPLQTNDILARQLVTQKAKVKHILLNWKDNNPRDDRAKNRDRAALDKLVKDTVAKLRKGDKIEPLMAELSEDPGSAKDGKDYEVTPDAGLVPPFKALSLRLNPKEVGVVKTQFGFHIIQRVE